MGFDNECILNIQSLAGEYFCPVCRLLVYPNEALQSQCTHLYCKPCLTYIVGTTRACPYDGYLVTEADSKPLIESNKALAETIGKIAVHCLYHRSGCQWQGPLSECTAHCSGCAFGNSPVVCNRCGIQIVHRQVQEHAQNCPGVQPQAPQVAGGQDVAAGATATAPSANAEQTQNANQSGASTSQVQTSLTLAGPPTGQDPNQQANANSQVQAVASAAAPTPEQWYQQQYQQQYHQHPGYDPYQQPYQNYYPYQQQAIQQYQQHPPHVQGQHQPQVYSQGQPHAQFQPQVQSQAQPAPPPPPPPPPQTHQPQSQPPPQLHAQPQPLQLVHAPVAAQASVNPQHQLQPTLQPHAQMHSQAQSQPHGHPHPQPYAQAQSHPQTHPVQPHLQQHMQIPQYQQPQSQMQHPQPYIPQPHSQVHPQHSFPQLQPPRHLQAQPQAQVQPQPQPQVQPQPQPQLQPQPHPRPQLPPPPQLNQPPNINAQSQTQHPPANAVTGLQSYPQPHAHQQMQLGAQQPPHMHPQGGPILQQPHQMGPPQSHAPVPKQQQPVLLSSQGQVPSIPPAQQQPVHPHAQQPGHPGLQRPVLQPMQQPVSQQYLQHQQPFPGQTLGSVQNQLHPHGHFIQQQQQPMQSQLRPQGPPHLEQQNSQDNISSQQNIALSHGLQTHQSQNYAARPMMPSHGAQSQPVFQSSVGFAGASQVRPMQLGTNQLPANLNYPLRSNHQMQMSSEQKTVQSGLTLKPRVLERQGDHMPEQSVADSKDGSSSQETALKESNSLVSTSVLGADSVQVNNLKSETDVKSKDVLQKPMSGDENNNSQVDLHVKDTDSELHAGGNASAEPAVKQMVKKEGNESGLDSSPGAKSVKTVAAGPEEATDLLQRAEHSADDGNSLQQVESIKKHSEKLEKDVIEAAMLVTGGADKGSQAIPLASAHTPDSFAESQTRLTGRESLLNGSQERNLSQSQPMTRGPGVDEFRSFPSHDQVLGKSFMPPGHPFPPTDQGRHQHMPMHYGPSSHQQRPAGAAMLQSALPHAQVPGQPPNMLRPQGPGHLPQPGPPLNPPDHLQPPVLKQPHGSFLPEIASGGILGPSSSSLGKGPSHFGPGRNFGPQSVASQGHYNQGHVPPSHAGLPRMSQGEPPGSFNSYGGLMGRAPPHGSEGQIGQQRPINPMESEVFLDQRSRHLDGRQSDTHLLGYSERAPFGHPHGIEANVMRMNGPPGTDSSSGLRDERFNRLTEGVNRFPMEPTWHVDRGELKEDLKQFPRNPHLDTEPGPKFGSYFSSSRPNDRGPHGFSVDAVSRPLDTAPHGFNHDAGLNLDLGVGNAPRVLPPYHPGGSNDTRYRAQPVGPDGNIGRADSTRTHPDFLGPFPGFGRRHMDWPTPRSPGREYHGFSTRDFRGLSGLDDISRESRPFGEGSRSFNLRGGELDGPGNVQSSDLIGQDILPNHLRRGEFLGPQNLRGDLLFGEPDGFGAFSGHAHMGDLAGPENFLHRLPRGEPFGGNKSGHPRLGEPGFRSSYSLTGGMDPFDNSRKRKLASMGWCRICKVDCETVEGLDLHAQTRQHQKMAMDMVLSIKKQNVKKQKTSNVHSSVEEPSKSRGNNYEVRGNKP